jgi:hypothetical protein
MPSDRRILGDFGTAGLWVAWYAGQPFSELESCDPGLGQMPVASAGTGQEQGELAWLDILP